MQRLRKQSAGRIVKRRNGSVFGSSQSRHRACKFPPPAVGDTCVSNSGKEDDMLRNLSWEMTDALARQQWQLYRAVGE